MRPQKLLKLLIKLFVNEFEELIHLLLFKIYLAHEIANGLIEFKDVLSYCFQIPMPLQLLPFIRLLSIRILNLPLLLFYLLILFIVFGKVGVVLAQSWRLLAAYE